MKKKVKTKRFKTIRVGGIEMKVFISSTQKDKNLKDRWGYVNYLGKKIVLQKGLTNEEKAYVILHELVHTVDQFCDGPFRTEKQVRHFSQHLWEALRDSMMKGLFKLNE